MVEKRFEILTRKINTRKQTNKQKRDRNKITLANEKNKQFTHRNWLNFCFPVTWIRMQ